MYKLQPHKLMAASHYAPYGTTHFEVNYKEIIYYSVEVSTGKVYRRFKSGWKESIFTITDLYSYLSECFSKTKIAPTYTQVKKYIKPLIDEECPF